MAKSRIPNPDPAEVVRVRVDEWSLSVVEDLVKEDVATFAAAVESCLKKRAVQTLIALIGWARTLDNENPTFCFEHAIFLDLLALFKKWRVLMKSEGGFEYDLDH